MQDARHPSPRIIRTFGLSNLLTHNREDPMNKYIVALFFSLPIAASAFESPLAFSDAKIALPRFSLMGEALQKVPEFVSDFEHQLSSPAEPIATVSSMPIICPKGDLDPKMVKAPDPSIEYKLTVKIPNLTPAK